MDTSLGKKEEMLGLLRIEFQHWEKMLNGLSESESAVRPAAERMSIKETVAHLMAWQQLSVARLEAAHSQNEPVMPVWVAGKDPDAESQEETDQLNAAIDASYRDRTWAQVYQEWRGGFLKLAALAEALPEAELLRVSHYPWLPRYALSAVLEGWHEHHREHRDP